MVLGDDQHMLLPSQRQQTHAQQRPTSQVEWLADFLGHPLAQRCFARPGAILQDNAQRHVRQDRLARLTVDLLEAGAQGLVAQHQPIEGLLQRRLVQDATHVQYAGEMIGRAFRLQFPEEPHALLSMRQRQLGDSRQYLQHRGSARRLGLQGSGEVCQDRPLEQDAQGYVQLQILAQARDHPGGAEGVTAEFEEVLVAGDALDTEQRLPDRCDRTFEPLPRRLSGLAAGSRVHLRQRLAIQLAVGVQRQAGQHLPSRRLHVRRQASGQPGAQLRQKVLTPHSVTPHQVGRQQRTTDAIQRHDRCFRHIRVCKQLALDFADLDAETTDLDLLIGPAEIFDLTVDAITRQVPGAIQALART